MPDVGLRGRLAAFVLLALLPTLALVVWSRGVLRADEVEEAAQRVRVLSALVADAQAVRDEGARQTLLGVVRMVERLGPESQACAAFLRDFGAQTASTYVNFGIVRLDGRTVCASRENTGRNVDVREWAFFQRAVEAQQFTVGELIRGENSGEILINYLHPLFEDGVLGGIAIASLDIDEVRASLAAVPLPLDAAVAILDRTGAVVASVPGEAWLEPLDAEMLATLAGSDRTLRVATGSDGVEREIAFQWVDGRRDLLAAAGIRNDIGLGEADRIALAALVVVSLWGVGLAVLVFSVSERQIRRPLEGLLATARRLGAGDTSSRAEVTGNSLGFDEVGQALNRMADALATREQQGKDAERLEAIGQIAGGLAHDFNNLLTVIIGFGHTLESQVRNEEGREHLRQLLAAAERASTLTRELLAFARRQEMQAQALHLSTRVSAVAPMLQRVGGDRVSVAFELEPDLGTVRADPAQIEQILLNLILNARDAMPRGGHITIATRNRVLDAAAAAELHAVGNEPVPPGAYVVLEISDTGEGISPAVKQRIFEPFFSTKGARGTGLGLSTVYGTVAQTGGFLFCESEVGRGTTFTILLPRIEEAPTAVPEKAEATASEASTSGSETVLIVEDEASVRTLAERILRDAGYRTATADSAAAALARLRDGLQPTLVLTDVMMPRMSGVALAETLRSSFPGVHVLYMSGHVASDVAKAGRIDPNAFLAKPFRPAELLQAVRRALDAPPRA